MWWFAACADQEPGSQPEPAPPDPGWIVGADLPAPRQECGVVALDGRVVVIGGYDDQGRIVDLVEAYDPVADAWTPLASLPEPLHHPNVAVLDGRIHVAGALTDNFLELGHHWVYDPDTDAWSAAAELPDDLAVGAAGAAVLDGRLHLVGGLQLTRSVALHSVYDPATDAREALPDAPSPRDHLAVGVVDDRLVATAGRAGGIGGFVAATEIWDGAGWSTGAPIPTPRGGVMAAVGPDGRLHVVGGEGNTAHADGVFGDHEAYDPQTDTWEAFGAMRTPRHGSGGAWLDGILWVPGGAPIQAFGAVAVNEGWRP